jgi:hypothetical protein
MWLNARYGDQLPYRALESLFMFRVKKISLEISMDYRETLRDPQTLVARRHNDWCGPRPLFGNVLLGKGTPPLFGQRVL